MALHNKSLNKDTNSAGASKLNHQVGLAMKQTDQIQRVVDDFQRESSLSQIRFRKKLHLLFIPFILVVFAGFAFLSYKAGAFYRALVIAGIGVLILIAGLRFTPKNPPRVLSLKERLWFWGSLIVYTIGFWFLKKWL